MARRLLLALCVAAALVWAYYAVLAGYVVAR
jgi:hypothetical protein